MAYGSALVDTIQSSTTGTPPQFNDGSGAQIGTLCRAWVRFSASGGVISGVVGFNVSSVTRTGTGAYSVNFSTAFSDTNYSVSLGNNNSCYVVSLSTGSLNMTTFSNITQVDSSLNYLSVFR